MNRTKKSFRNVVFAMVSQAIVTVIAFVTRTIMVKTIGDENISLNGLFTEVIAALSLAELGIGSAIVYNLYKPLAENDQTKVCQLMTLFKKIYRIIALVTFLIGLALCPIIQYLIRDINYPLSYIRLIYMLFVIQISVSYLFTYKASLLNADQNQHIQAIISTSVRIVGSIMMIIGLVVSKNYIVYLVLNIATTIMVNVLISRKVDRLYPYLVEDFGLPIEEKEQLFSNVKNIFVKQLSGKITNSTDNILISVLVSTLYVGKYSYYALIISTFKQFIEQINGGISASVGNLFAVESMERCERILFRLTWMLGSMAVFIGTCIYCCVIPFICFWVGEKYILTNDIVLVLCLNLFAYIASKPIYLAMHVSGLFKEGRNISIVGSTVNLITSIILGIRWGMLGIFIGTSMTYLIQIVLKIKDIYRLKFHHSCRKYAVLWGILVFDLLLGMFVGSYACNYINVDGYLLRFFVFGIVGAITSIAIISITSFRREEWQYCRELMVQGIRRIQKK